MIQEAVNRAISSAAGALAVAKGIKAADRVAEERKADEAKALREKKEKQDELLADKRGLDAAPQAMKAASQLEESLGEESELRKRSEEIEGKISIRAQRLEKDKSLTRRQQGGYKGYITKMQRAQEPVREKLEAREFQSELMAKRLEILKRMHGDAWARMGFDPTKKGGKL